MSPAVPLRDLLHGPSILADYWEGTPALRELLPRHFLDADSFTSLAPVLQRRSYQRVAVSAALERQNRALGADEAALAAARRLADPRALVVIGGQQAGLLGGPLYTLHKALTIRALAAELERGLGCPVVPLFWIASDDHDLAEVSRTWLTGADGRLCEVALSAHQAAAAASKVPVSTVRLGPGIATALRDAAAALGGGARAREAMEAAREAWREDATFPEAFGRWMHLLLAGLGVALVDPADPELKRLGLAPMRREVAGRGLLATAVREQTVRLAAAGYRGQIEMHDGMLGLFAHLPGRTAIVVREHGFEAKDGGGRWSDAELADALEREPARFSPNAALRPLVQDALFPTVAFVLGPAETAYAAQLTLAYERFDIPMPVLFPRASLTLVESPIARLLGKRGLSLAEVISLGDRLATELSRRSLPAGLEARIAAARGSFEGAWREIGAEVLRVDPTLARTAGLAARRSLQQLEFIEGKAARGLKRRDGELRGQAARLAAALAPRGGLQERAVCPLPFVARHGFGLAKTVLGAIDIHRGEHQEVSLP